MFLLADGFDPGLIVYLVIVALSVLGGSSAKRRKTRKRNRPRGRQPLGRLLPHRRLRCAINVRRGPHLRDRPSNETHRARVPCGRHGKRSNGPRRPRKPSRVVLDDEVELVQPAAARAVRPRSPDETPLSAPLELPSDAGSDAATTVAWVHPERKDVATIRAQSAVRRLLRTRAGLRARADRIGNPRPTGVLAAESPFLATHWLDRADRFGIVGRLSPATVSVCAPIHVRCPARRSGVAAWLNPRSALLPSNPWSPHE